LGGNVFAAEPVGEADEMRLTASETAKVNVAFVIGPHATMIDFAGPWEVFQDVHVPGRGASHDDMMPFNLYTVAESTEPVIATGGMKIIPDYSFDSAPEPQVIVVPAVQSSEAMLEWLKRSSQQADVTMSVCTGAFIVAKAGLLDGKLATTHHNFFEQFEERFPDVDLRKGHRFVENEGISTAGGLTSGIDLALRVVERYFGTQVAETTAEYMEYESQGWRGEAISPASAE
jgi:transcriptional regulator GlxA family with amidase domain